MCQLETKLKHQWVPRVNCGSKFHLLMSHTAGEGPDGTLGAHTITYGTWYSLLRATSPSLG